MPVEFVIQDYLCTDIPDIERWRPATAEQVYFHLSLTLGLADEEAGSYFRLTVATPQALRQHATQQQRRGKLVVISDYSWENLLGRLRAILHECRANTDHEVIDMLRKRFSWEYEGMDPS